MANIGGNLLQVDLNSSAFDQALLNLIAQTQSKEKILGRIGGFMREKMVLCFRDSQDPYGNQWLPLKYRNGKPLLDTGRLRNSITYKISGNSVQAGTNVDYAAVHQNGARIGSRLGLAAFDKKGRFESRAKSAKRKKGFTPISVHRIGEGNIPARPFAPDSVRGLPESWRLGILEELRGFLKT